MSIWIQRAKGVQGGPGIDAAEVRRALAALADPAHGVELRALPSGKSRVLPGGDLDGLVSAAAELGESAKGVYWTLNPIPCALTHPARAGDVLARRWLLIDVDPARPKDTNATDQEHRAARAAAGAVMEHLCDLGWPSPLLVDSGNGWHLLYRIDLPADKLSQALLRQLLHRLAEQFDTPAATLDRAVHNASRISKLPGTWARKGPATDERPHRLCRLAHLPESPEVVTLEQLRQAAGVGDTQNGDTPSAPPPPPGRPDPFLLRVLDSRSRAYAAAALEREAARVKLADPGGRNNTLNRAAFALGTLVWAGLLSRGDVESALTLAAHQAGLGERETHLTIRSGVEAGVKAPRQVPERNGHHADNGHAPPPADSTWCLRLDDQTILRGRPDDITAEVLDADVDTKERYFQIHTLGGLMGIDFPEPRWVVPGVLSEGLNLLAGAPKMGKSMLALNLALTIAGGGMALGNVQVGAGPVLYLSLEDKQRRVKARSVKMMRAIDPDLADRVRRNLSVATDWPRQNEGGLHLIDAWVRKVDAPTLLIIDVWARFVPPYKQSGSTYAQDSEYMGAVKRYADRRGFHALIVHHTRKPSLSKDSEDYVQEVSGTLGLTGAADGVIVLTRSRKDNQASLHITGRDVSEQELVLEFDPETLTWKSIGTADQHIEGRVQQTVVGYLKGLGGASAFVAEIAQRVGEKEDSVRKALHRLRADKVVRKTGNAWSYPGDDPDEVVC